jgi:hypothetical protein
VPLSQPLPSSWTNQHVIADASNTNITANDFIISNSGVKLGSTGKNYIALKMPFCSFYVSNQGAGTVVLVFTRASDGVPLYVTAVQPVTSTTGDQFRQITLPVDDVNPLTLTTVKTGTVSLSIVASGLVDTGLLPLPEEQSLPPSQTFSAGGVTPLGQVAKIGSARVSGQFGK